MSTTNIRPVKYIFLDVVAYTKRTIEAQCDIITTLNKIVKDTLDKLSIGEGSVIYIPTGDGICIALVDATLPYDIHVSIAKDILRRLWTHNQFEEDKSRKFEVRIGVNQSDDNLVKDINDRENVTGGGINNARRIMDLADGSQILVSGAVYEILHLREKYLDAFTKYTAAVKHGLVLDVYQLVKADIEGLNVNPPSSFATPSKPEPKLTKLTAYYFAHLMKNQGFILDKARDDVFSHEPLKLLLWFLAKDSENISERSPYATYDYRVMPDTGSDTIEGQFEWFREKIPYKEAIWLSRLTLDNAVPRPIQDECLEEMSSDLVVNSKGKEKLKRDWPEIWDEFRLDELSG